MHLSPTRICLVALALTVAGAVAVTVAVPSPAFAASGGGGNSGGGGGSGGGGSGGGGSGGGSGHGGGSGGGSAGEGPIHCNTKKGWAYDAKKDMCVHSSLLDDKELYAQGRALAVAGHYDEALDILAAVRDQHDAMVLTMIGYSKRKLGHVDEGMAYYDRALAIEPDNINTHEYLGEGYVAVGKVQLAKLELDKLARICGTGCEQYEDLAKAIVGHPEE
jgi:hypothetical protein